MARVSAHSAVFGGGLWSHYHDKYDRTPQATVVTQVNKNSIMVHLVVNHLLSKKTAQTGNTIKLKKDQMSQAIAHLAGKVIASKYNNDLKIELSDNALKLINLDFPEEDLTLMLQELEKKTSSAIGIMSPQLMQDMVISRLIQEKLNGGSLIG